MVLMTSGPHSHPLACPLLLPRASWSLFSLPEKAQILAGIPTLHFLCSCNLLQYCSTQNKATIPATVYEALCDLALGAALWPWRSFPRSDARAEAQGNWRETAEKDRRMEGFY